MRKVGNMKYAVYERQAERYETVDTPQRHTVDYLLKEEIQTGPRALFL